jgi:hypothetical protein
MMRGALSRGCFVLCLLALGVVAAEAKNASVTVVNQSDWEIHQLYLSSSDDEEWGPDQLGEAVIESGGSFKLEGIPCDTYDVMLVDEDEDPCIVTEVDICGAKQKWTITNEILLGCQKASG